MAEITIAEDVTGGGVGGNDPFSEFGEFGDEFGGGMEDIEKARKAVTFEEEKDRTDRDSLQVCTTTCTPHTCICTCSTHGRCVYMLYCSLILQGLYMYMYICTYMYMYYEGTQV